METLYETVIAQSRISLGLLTILGTLVAIVVGSMAFFISQPGSLHYRCRDFGSYSAVLVAFNAGAAYLDGYPRNGIPCDSYFSPVQRK